MPKPFVLALGALLVATGALAQGTRPSVDLATFFHPKVDVMIPMRDGVTLHTEIYFPKSPRPGPRPILLERTPYYANPGEQQWSPRLRWYTEFFDGRYIFVLQDLRGRYLSAGQHRTLRPPKRPDDPNGIDESTDFYDTIDWLVKNVPNNNQRVGTFGISYGGFLATRAMIDPHPALKAVSPQASCADMFIGDDFHHNGAFRLHYSFVAASVLETNRPASMLWSDRYDLYQWFLDLGPLSNINRKYLNGESPLWNAFVEHPDLDDHWRKEVCGVLPFLQGVTVPALHVLGWFDAEDFYGPLKVYQQLERDDARNRNYLIIGPWTHGGWTFDEEGRNVGAVRFDSATARGFRQEVHARWFAHWLDDGPLDFPEARIFQTGSNRWESFDRWPPRTTTRSVFLQADGRIDFAPPAAGPDRFRAYESDPAKPVPSQKRPVRYPETWSEWQAEDQRVAHGRPDVLSWVSPPLTEELSLAGDAVAHLFASTSATDSDWIVKLIDVYPDSYPSEPAMGGYQFMVAGEVFRGRYHKSFERPAPLEPGRVMEYVIHLRDRSHLFRRGHRIMVQVQSTWFPLIDRNPQTFVPNIFLARAEDFKPATQRIYGSARYPTRIELPIR